MEFKYCPNEPLEIKVVWGETTIAKESVCLKNYFKNLVITCRFRMSFFTEFIGVTLADVTTQVSRVQFNKTLAVSCVVCSPKVKAVFIPTFPYSARFHLPTHCPLWPLPFCCLRLCVMYMLNPFTIFHPAPQPSSTLTAVSLFYVSMLVFLFSLLNVFVD